MKGFALLLCALMIALQLAAEDGAACWVSIVSTKDGTSQPAWFWAPETRQKVPLLVDLHSWSAGCERKGEPNARFLADCRHAGWAIIGPHFRGPNKTPQACGSDLAVQDVVDAVAWAKEHVAVDDDRVYLAGSSGGGMMALLAAGRHPEIWAGCCAACPISDLARWHRECSAFTDWRHQYAVMMEESCGGTPATRNGEFASRSPLTHLGAARRQGLAIDIYEGIHDGHTGSVPVGHAIRAFNALADEKSRISEADIAFVEQNEKMPVHLAGTWNDPFFGDALRIHFRRMSDNVRLTLFEGGHSGNNAAAFDWLGRQRRGRPADWSIPKSGKGREDVSLK